MDAGVKLGGARAEADGGILVGGLNMGGEKVVGDRRHFEREANLNVGGRCGGDDEEVIFEMLFFR